MLYKVAGICVSSLEGLFCCQLNLLITKFNFKIILFHFLNLNTYTEFFFQCDHCALMIGNIFKIQ